MAGRRETAVLSRTILALSIALSGSAPSYAALRAPQPVIDDAAMSALLLKVQSVDRGDNNGGRNNNGGGYGDRNDSRAEYPWLFQRLDTDTIVADLYSIRRECRNYDQVYRIDCLRQGIEQTILRMSDRPENRDAKRILRRASRKLAAIVATYNDPQAPLLEAPRSANPRFKKHRVYRAVKRSALPEALAKADAVVTEAATELLRSAENSERRYAHYQQISAAVDSTKTLLRSG